MSRRSRRPSPPRNVVNRAADRLLRAVVAPTSILPALGESVTEGTVSRWLKQVGESVAADEPLLEISTDKVDTEIPSPAAGVLLEIRVQEDETVEVGAVLAVVGEESAARRARRPRPKPRSRKTGTETGGETPEEQTAAGDEGGQAPIPAPEPEAKQEPEAEPQPERPSPHPTARASRTALATSPRWCANWRASTTWS